MIQKMKIGICGDVCSECPRYIATQNNDTEALEKVAELWHRLKLRDKIVSPDELRCTGCSSELDCAFRINTCKYLNGRNNCGECDFFPCEKIEEAFKKTENFAMFCKRKCTDLEYSQLENAFLNKRKVLTKINDDNLRT
jgi:hypothetical protein